MILSNGIINSFSGLLPLIFTFVFCLLAGWFLGIITGTIPGIHVNTISAILVSSSPFLSDAGIPVAAICLVIISCAISNTFHNIIPAVFLGVPGEDTAFAVMPGHRLLMSGKGLRAIRVSAAGSIGSVILSPFLMIPLAIFLVSGYSFLSQYLGYVLIALSLLVILTEPTLKQKIICAFLFVIVGIFGYVALNSPETLFEDSGVLLPLLSGLFGASQIIISLFEGSSSIPDSPDEEDEPVSGIFRSLLHGTIFGAFVSWIPGASSSIAAIMSGLFIENSDSEEQDNENPGFCEYEKIMINGREYNLPVNIQEIPASDEISEKQAIDYIVSVSAINTANAVFGILAYFIIHKSRSGAVSAVDGLLSAIGIDMKNAAAPDQISWFFLFYAIAVACSFLSYFTTIRLGRVMRDFMKRVNYRALSAGVLVFLFTVVFILSGIQGIMLFIVSSLFGLLPTFLHVRKACLMSVIIIPVMIYFL